MPWAMLKTHRFHATLQLQPCEFYHISPRQQLVVSQLYIGMVGTPVDHCVRTVMGKFPQQEDTPEWIIIVSNNQHRRLNKHINDEMHNIHGGLYTDPTHQYDGQSCWLFGGMHVVGGATDQGIV